jgi:glucose-1-phosphate thymidylyltransferase
VDFPGVTIHEPVYIEDGVLVEGSEIGPNVSLERGTKVSGSTLRNAIVGRESTITDAVLDGALLGNYVVVEGYRGGASLGDHSEVTSKG